MTMWINHFWQKDQFIFMKITHAICNLDFTEIHSFLVHSEQEHTLERLPIIKEEKKIEETRANRSHTK